MKTGSSKGPHKLLVESEGTNPGLPMAPPTNEDTFYHVQMFVQHAENPEEGSWIEASVLLYLSFDLDSLSSFYIRYII